MVIGTRPAALTILEIAEILWGKVMIEDIL